LTRTTPTWLAWGGLAAALYLASALWTVAGQWPVRMLYDGFIPPPPYRWVRPPAAVAAQNQGPQTGAASIGFTGEGSEYASVATRDGQAIAIFGPNAFVPSPGESAVRITLAPLDPAMISPAPAGLRVEGNAYRIDGTYAHSQRPVALRKPVTVVLRYPSGGTRILRFAGPTWTALRTTSFHMSLQMLADSDRLGIFAAAAPAAGAAAFLTGLSRGALLAVWTALGVMVVLLLRSRLRRRLRNRVARDQQTASPRPTTNGRGPGRGLAVAHARGCGTIRM
jgi:membrane protein implicated in regulation of membrane protease activity